MASGSEVRPRSIWYWAGAAVMVFGVVAAIVVFVFAFQGPVEEIRELDRKIDAMQRFPVPGDGRVRLDGTGEFVIYAEGFGTAAELGTFDPSSVTVEPTQGEPTEVVVEDVFVDETYDFGGPAGRASVEFTVDEPGVYLITIDSAPSGVNTAAVGRRLDLIGTFTSIGVAILVPLGVGLLFLTLGGVIMIVTGVRRSSSSKRLRMASAPPGGGFGPPPGAAWPPPGTPGGWGAPPPPPPPPGTWGAAPPAPTWPPAPTAPAQPPSWPPPPDPRSDPTPPSAPPPQ